MMGFVKKLFLFLLLFFLFDKIFYLFAHYSAESEADRRLEYLLNGKINKDIIVLGSSLGSRDIIAGRIEERTGVSAYNLCYPGSNPEFQEFILRTLLSFNRNPRLVILSVDDDTQFRYDTTGSIIYRYDRLYPLVKYRYIRDELVARGEKDRILSKILVLHNLNMSNFDIRKKRFTPADTIIKCGSMPVSWRQDKKDHHYVSGIRAYDKSSEKSEYTDAFSKIVNLCDVKGIRLIIVFPPLLKTHSVSFEERIRELGGSKPYYYVYDSGKSIYGDTEYYFDDTHLMKKGALVFTDELVDYLVGAGFLE